VPLKKHLNFIIAIFLTITLSNCKKDCNGSYTIEGTLWNGTKNQPRKGILVKAVAGRGNSLFSGGSNVQDVGNDRTDENGYFKITYNCIGDDMTGISLSSPDLPYSGISNDDRLPINQDYKRTYNIPDSVSLIINFSSTNMLGPDDTLYYMIGIPYNNEEKYFVGSSVPTGFYKNFRIPYKIALNNNFTIKIKAAKGRVAYNNELRKSPENLELNNVKKLEPEVNEFTIYY
jgi:hypothetical protein